jgi:hypothetical protein
MKGNLLDMDTPVTTEQDRRYLRAEGVMLVSRIWVEEESEPAMARQASERDAFVLLWDETTECAWVAVYRMCVNVGAHRCVSFVVLKFLGCHS